MRSDMCGFDAHIGRVPGGPLGDLLHYVGLSAALRAAQVARAALVYLRDFLDYSVRSPISRLHWPSAWPLLW